MNSNAVCTPLHSSNYFFCRRPCGLALFSWRKKSRSRPQGSTSWSCYLLERMGTTSCSSRSSKTSKRQVLHDILSLGPSLSPLSFSPWVSDIAHLLCDPLSTVTFTLQDCDYYFSLWKEENKAKSAAQKTIAEALGESVEGMSILNIPY